MLRSYKNKQKVWSKTITMVLICLVCANPVLLADPNSLAPLVGNPKVYQQMRSMMEDRIAAHQANIDTFIKQHVNKAKGLLSIPYLEDEFTQCVKACNAEDMINRLKTTLTYTGGKIQIIFLEENEQPPKFEGKNVWGHAGTYITVFALESEKDSREGRRKIIARIFHEIRARSTSAKKLFEKEFSRNKPATPVEIETFTKLFQEKFEKDNRRIQHEIEQNGRIKNNLLREEFIKLTFTKYPQLMNRDYMMADSSEQFGEVGQPMTFLLRLEKYRIPADLASVKKVIQDGIDWAIAQGYPYPDVLYDYKEAVGLAEEVPEKAAKVGLFAKYRKLNHKGILLSSSQIQSRLELMVNAGSTDYFIEHFIATLVREAWGWQAFKLAGPEEKELNEVGVAVLIREPEHVLGGSIKFPSEALNQFLISYEQQITRLAALNLAGEFHEAMEELEFLNWAREKELYSPDRIETFLQNLPFSKMKEDLIRYREHSKEILKTRGNPEDLIVEEFYAAVAQFANFTRGSRTLTERAYAYYFFLEVMRFMNSKGKEGMDIRVLHSAHAFDLSFPSAWFRSSALRLLPEIQKIISKREERSHSAAVSQPIWARMLPSEWLTNEFDTVAFLTELSRILQIENNILAQDKSTFIFSEKVAFDNGLGVLLPKLAKFGMRIAVITTNDRQRALIDELNQGKPENERIVHADTIADIITKVHTARYYYFKVMGDPTTDLQGVTTFDITDVIKKIIDALGKVSGIIEHEKIELLHEAARKFAEAA